jgi:hypothetical protein
LYLDQGGATEFPVKNPADYFGLNDTSTHTFTYDTGGPYVENYTVCVTPTPTPSATPSNTPSITPSNTPSETPSVTPSITPSETPSITPSVTPSTSPASLTNIEVDNTLSDDVPITGISVNAVSVTYVSGTDFTINAGQSGIFSTNQIGTYDIQITYGANIGGQNINFTDSALNVYCHDVNSAGGTFTITGATITSGVTMYVLVTVGACI